MRQPLEGIRVLELGMYHAGPGATAILGDLGAEVVKIERPMVGDPTRMGKHIGQVDLTLPGGASIWHEAANRGKRSITISLDQAKGREVAYRLVKQSDIFLTSLRQPALENMKMTYEVLSEIQPKLIYAQVSGYGSAGIDRNVGAFDPHGQARSGMMFSVGSPDDPPLGSQIGILDQTTSIMASHAILTALFMRERTGIGQKLDISLLGTAVCMQYLNVLVALVIGHDVPRTPREVEWPLRNLYKCSDGSWIIVVIAAAGNEESQWPRFCRMIERPDIANDTRFDTIEKTRSNAEQLVPILDEVFATRPSKEWLNLLAEHDFPAAPVQTYTQLKEDQQIIENQYIVNFDHPKLGAIQVPGYPIHFSEAYAGTRTAAPELGQDTEAVLTAIGGYTQKEIAGLKEAGVI